MSTEAKHGGVDRSYREVVNPPRPAGRYRLLDRNSDPRWSLPTTRSAASVNRPCDPHCQKGS